MNRRYAWLEYILIVMVLVTASDILVAKSPPKPSVHRFAFTANSLDHTITSYRIDQQMRLRPIAHTWVSETPNDLAVHPAGRYLYTLSKSDDTVSIFRINSTTGTLKAIRGSPFGLEAGQPSDILFHPSGRFAYIASLTGVVMAFEVDSQSGMLTPAAHSPHDSGRYTRSLAAHPSGRFIYAVNAHSNSISGFAVNTKTGTLTAMPKSPFDNGSVRSTDTEESGNQELPEESGGIPYAAVVDQRGRYLYVTNWAGGSVSVFRVSNKDGSLQSVRGSPFVTGANPYAPALHPSGEFLYVSSWVSDAIWAYRIKNTTGALKALKDGVFPTQGYSPLAMVFDTGGKHAYVLNGESSSIAMFEVTKKSGALELIETVQTRPGPWSIAFQNAPKQLKSRSKFAFAVDSYSNKISFYEINQKTGGLGIVETSATGKNPREVYSDSNNKLIYVANGESNNLSVYVQDPTTDAMREHTDSPFNTGTLPVAVEAYGSYVYVVNQVSNSLSVFNYDAASGNFKEHPSSPRAIGEKPSAIAIDSAGRFAYTTNLASNDITILSYGMSSEPVLFEKVYMDSPIRTGKKPMDIVIDPTSSFALVANAGSNNISVYTVNYESGSLTSVKGSPFRTGTYPNGIVMHPNGKYVYVSNMRSKNISQFLLDSLTGKLKEVKPRVAIGMKPSKMAIDATGQYLYVASEAIAEIKQFKVSSKSGKLSKSPTISTIGANASLTLTADHF